MQRAPRNLPPFRDVSAADWADWRWHARHALRTPEALSTLVRLTADEEAGIAQTRDSFAFEVSPYYASLMDPDDPTCPVRMMTVPHRRETVRAPGELRDPLGEDTRMVVPGLVHRYPDRALLLLNNMCALYCRFCTRKRLTGLPNEAMPRAALEQCIDYLRRTPAIRDVIVSGGDPLLASDRKLDEVLGLLRTVPSVEIVRIGTRLPVVLPQRVTPELVAILRRHRPLWVMTHFNHPVELTPEATAACERLVDAGLPVCNQSVLLRGVNSSAALIRELCHGLVRHGVRPYYLHQCDLAEGLEGFRTPIVKGMEILEALQGHTSGFVVPRFVVDLPGGAGKVPLQPGYILSQGEHETVLRSYDGRIVRYPEPRERDCTCGYEAKWNARPRPEPVAERRHPDAA